MQLPRTKSEGIRLVVIVAAVVAGGWFISHQFESLDLEQLLRDVSDTLGGWTYLLAGVLAFLETGAFVGLVVPGETFVILAGAVAGQGATDVWVTIAIVWFSAWAGDTTSFLVGRRLGRGFILRHGPRVRITEERFRQVEGYFESHGGKTILVGRFIGLVRALAPFVAGSSGMAYRAFLPYSVLGTGLWSATFTVLGYLGSRSIERIADWAGTGVLLFGIAVGVIVAIVAATRFLRVERNRAAVVAWMERRAPLRPLVALGRRVKPQARFLWARVTPGNLGLELTALLAVLAVAAFVVVGYTDIVSGDPGPTAGDETAFEVAGDLRAGWLVDVAEVVTELGSSAVTLPVAAVAAVLLAMRRRWVELGALVAALAILHAAVPILKEAIDRPRPAAPLDEADGDSFPSGHAAYSVLYAWIALTIAVRLRPGRAGGAAVIACGIALAAAIGLSRVYLRVHYLSDVSAGWALGASVFALCAIVALVATHLGRDGRFERTAEVRENAPP
jgi:membrane protein DedA with SNARE-associated domain/membrane-associated phospholipid phosphatase